MATERKLYFNVSARMAKLIGKENFANAEGAIIELVKNSYDADAPFCAVVFDIRESKTDSSVYIIDTGCGMDDNVIENQWMTIGTDDKLINYESRALKRIKSGAKGIGRFALNRLGKVAEMLTFEEGKSIGYDWNINWDDFNTPGSTLSGTGAIIRELDRKALFNKLDVLGITNVEEIKVRLNKETFHGTVLCIKNLNDEWTKEALALLSSNLELLVPSHLAQSFEMFMFTLSDLTMFGKVNIADYDDFDYKVAAHYDGGGARKINVKIQRKELNLSLLETEYLGVFEMPTMKDEPYRLEDFKSQYVECEATISDSIPNELLCKIGRFDFIFYFVKNTKSDDSDKNAGKKYPYRDFNSSQRREWLNKYRGVKIYRDQFRVRPYGEPGNDWLQLGERQSQSPGGVGSRLGGYRIRPNQISGSVFISRFENQAFEDKSSREGIMENDEFKLLQNLLKSVIEVFERDRNTIMYNLSQYYKQPRKEDDRAKETSEKINEKEGNTGYSKATESERILAKAYSKLEDELNEKESEIRMLRGLASSGIAMAAFTHEFRQMSNQLVQRIDLLKDSMSHFISEQKTNGLYKLDNPYYLLNLIKNGDVKLKQWMAYSLNAIRRNKRDQKDINLTEYFESFRNSWEGSLEQKNIKIEIVSDEVNRMPVFFGYEMDLDSIFNNLVTNSVASLLRTDERNKTITMKWSLEKDSLILEFIDNGLGLSKEYEKNPYVIFEAFETSSRDKNGNKTGTGMGLYIVKGIIDSYPDASIMIMPLTKGFGMKITLKIKEYE